MTGREATAEHAYDCRCQTCEKEAAAEWVRMHDSWGVLDDPAPSGREPTCCDGGPEGHTEQEHHDGSACFDQACRFDHPHGGPFPHPCDLTPPAREPTA